MERFEQLYRDWKKEAKKLVNDLDVLPIEALVQVFDHVDIEKEMMDDVRKAVSLLVLEETTQLPRTINRHRMRSAYLWVI